MQGEMTIVTQAAPAPTAGWPRLQALAARCFTRQVCVVAGLAVFVFLLVPPSMDDPDIWWHLRNVEVQLRMHAILTRDGFSFSAHGAPWMNHEWLAEVPFSFGWRLGGVLGVYLVTLLASQAILLGVFHLAYRLSGSLRAAGCSAGVAALLATVSLGPRTLLFGWVCLLVELTILEAWARREPVIHALPLLFLVWVNTHGSWIIGLVVLGVFTSAKLIGVDAGAVRNVPCQGRLRRGLFAAVGLSCAALFVNPYGWRLVVYPFNLAFRQRLNIGNLEEWRALDFHTPRGRLMLCVLGVVFLTQLVRRRSWSLVELGFVAIGVYSALNYTRFLFLFAILAMPVFAVDFALLLRSSKVRRAPRDRPTVHAALLFAMLCLVVSRARSMGALEQRGMEGYPVQALGYLHGMKIDGNVFNDFLWGGFLIWHTPRMPVFVDSRVDLFEYSGVFRDYLDAVRLKESLPILDKYKIRYVVFARDAPLVYLLEHTSGWKIDYEDSTAVVLERTTAIEGLR